MCCECKKTFNSLHEHVDCKPLNDKICFVKLNIGLRFAEQTYLELFSVDDLLEFCD